MQEVQGLGQAADEVGRQHELKHNQHHAMHGIKGGHTPYGPTVGPRLQASPWKKCALCVSCMTVSHVHVMAAEHNNCRVHLGHQLVAERGLLKHGVLDGLLRLSRMCDDVRADHVMCAP